MFPLSDDANFMLPRLALLFVVVLVLNVIPAFAPPTWVAVSLFGLRYRGMSPLLLAAVAAPAATTGRVVLSKLSTSLVRNRLLGDATRANVDVVRRWLEKKAAVTATGTLLFAFSPFPSNALFIAYGLTSLPLRRMALPFLVGRFMSYAGWSWAAQSLATRLAARRDPASFFDWSFVVGQTFTVLLIVLFTRLDWRALFTERKLRLMSKHPAVPPGEGPP